MGFDGSFGPIYGRFQMILKILDKMASLWFVLEFDSSFRLGIVDLGQY